MSSEKLLGTSSTFCMLPWIHLHVWPDGTTFPCCFFSNDEPVGSMREKSLEELWNSDRMKRLRLAMLTDQPTQACSRCYELEHAGSPSLRTNLNQSFAHHFPRTASTRADGSVDGLNFAYFDVRFSNLCNFKCRTCGPDLSSSWYEDAAPGGWKKPKLLHPTRNPADLWRQIEPLIPGIEEVYFAGGEPLITDEHYQILKLLIAAGRTRVRVRYNTNFSTMVFRGEDVRELWTHFEDVSVGASLDAMGARGEYMRKGTEWQLIEDNRRRMLTICPKACFHISATLSIMNVLHFPDFHRAWIEAGLVGPSDLHINLLTFPAHYRIQVLPPWFKQQVHDRYREHLDFLAGFGGAADGAKRLFASALKFMDELDMRSELPRFRELTEQLDKLRGERFADVFPELARV